MKIQNPPDEIDVENDIVKIRRYFLSRKERADEIDRVSGFVKSINLFKRRMFYVLETVR